MSGTGFIQLLFFIYLYLFVFIYVIVVLTSIFFPPGGIVKEPKNPLLYLLAVAAAIILLILILGVLVAKRKRKHGVLWLPDGFLAKKDSKRREPVGQDDFGMK